MKQWTVFAFVLLACTSVQAKILQADTIIIHGTKFLFVKSVSPPEEYTGMDTLLKVYRIENGARHYLLTQTIFSESGDCNSIFRDHGKYEIRNDSVIFITEFEVERDKNFGLPYQQKQIYMVKDDGKMLLVFDRSEMEDGVWRDNLNPE